MRTLEEITIDIDQLIAVQHTYMLDRFDYLSKVLKLGVELTRLIDNADMSNAHPYELYCAQRTRLFKLLDVIEDTSVKKVKDSLPLN